MIRTPRHARNSRDRWSPRLEPLESRRLFSASPDAVFVDVGSSSSASSAVVDTSGPASVLSVVGTDPAPGAVIHGSPSALTITFDQPFDPTSVFSDIGLERVETDGTVTPLDPSILSEPLDLSAPTDTLVVTLLQPLDPGDYRIVLLGGAFLTGVDGEPLSNNGEDLPLGDFQVENPGVTLGDATDLGTVGTSVVVTAGALDFQADPTAVALYQFTLAPGHFWRVGAEVSAERDGPTLNSALALFDSQGHVLRTDVIGRPDATSDPYVFEGLGAGTYYLGVSGMGNLPGLPGGYDPASGLAGAIGQDQPGGPFHLSVVADPEDSPTQLLGYSLDRADPVDPRPTGLTLVFSGPMDVQSFLDSERPGAKDPVSGQPITAPTLQGLQLIDGRGVSWPLTAVAYQERNSQFTFIFQEPLPQGHYTLLVPSPGGVTDLAGLTPAATGEPAGVLASWDVAAVTTPADPNDLGALLGNADEGIPGDDVILAGDAVNYRFVVPTAGLYKIQTEFTGGALTVQTNGPDGPFTFDAGPSGQIRGELRQLSTGVYTLQFNASGPQSVHVRWVLSRLPDSPDSVFNGGVGQGPALDLRLINPVPPSIVPPPPVVTITPGNPPPTLPPDPSAGAPGVSTSLAAINPQPFLAGSPQAFGGGAATATVVTSNLSPAPSSAAHAGGNGLLLSLGNTLVGTPSAQANHVAAVGPGVGAGVTALAANTTGLLQGIRYGQALGPQVAGNGQDVLEGLDDAPAAPVNGAILLSRIPAAPNQDERALASVDWLGAIGTRLRDWFGSLPGQDGPALAPDGTIERIALTRDETAGEATGTATVAHAELTTSLGVGLASFLALRFRRPVRRWLEGRSRSQASRRRTLAATGRGPHARI